MKTLKTFLLVNGIFSSLTGGILISFTDNISSFIGQPKGDLVLMILGIALLGFGILVLSQLKFQNPLLILLIIFSDALWVVGSLILLLYQPFDMSFAGTVLIAIIALLVFVFGIGQTMGLAQLDHVSGNNNLKRLQFERIVNAPKKEVWEVISDVSNYHHVAPNIDTAKIVFGYKEQGMIRSCSHGSDRWTEVATLWEEGVQYSFQVNTDAEDYPYPFKYLKGNWKIEAESNECTKIIMTFDLVYRKSIQNILIHPLLRAKFSQVCKELLDNWERQISANITNEIPQWIPFKNKH